MIFKRLTSEKYSIKIFAILFMLMLFSDFLMKLNLEHQFLPSIRYSGFSKIIFEIYILLFAFQKGINKRFIYLILILISSFFIGQYFLAKDSIFDNSLLEEFLKGDIYHLNKYILIILFVAVVKDYSHNLELSKTILGIMFIALSVNSVLVILGFVFDINLFQSFPGSTRFGYSGLFVKSGESVLLYMLASIYFYIRFLKGKSVFPALYFVLIALLSGKKIAFLILPLFYFVHFCIQSKNKYIYRFLGVIILATVLFFKKVIIQSLVVFFPFWEKLLEEKGFWTVIFSTRDLNFYHTLGFIHQNWKPINYIFGGTNYNQLRIEIDPFDLFVFFGLIGGMAFLTFVFAYFLKPFKNRIVKFLFLGYVIVAMIYGAFLFNILLMTILYLFVILCTSPEKDSKALSIL